MSFPAFDYEELFAEDWLESEFLGQLEKRYLFIIFKKNRDGNYSLAGAKFWTMPSEDIEVAMEVWDRTREQIKIAKYSAFPKSSENSVAHVRPHARNRFDTSKTPQGESQMKRSFWLNRKYIAKILA